MSIWAGIKYALNSTLGTSGFKPLDKLIRFEGKKLVASDTAFLKIPISTIYLSTTYGEQPDGSELVDICTMKPLVGGTARLSANMTIWSTKSGTGTYAYVYVYVNGVKKHTFSQYYELSSGGSSSVSRELTGDITFDANDEITFKLKVDLSGTVSSNSSGRVKLSTMQLNAITTDNLIEVVSV